MIKKTTTINVVWIVNDLYLNNFITVYNECKNDKRFNLTILATSHTGINESDNISSNQVYNFLKKNNINCINSWNKTKKEYIDINNFNPNYIFTTTPYDIYLPEQYRSYNLKKNGKLCNIEYGTPIIEYTGLYDNFLKNNPYFNNAWIFFTSSNQDYLKKLPCKYKTIGCLKLDEYLYYKKNPFKKYKWDTTDKKTLKVVWKPRWTILKEDSNLFKYIDNFYLFLKKNKNINFIFLFHPLLISSIESNGRYKYFNKWLEKLLSLSNFKIENSSNFLDCVLSADVLIADHSSTIAEFATTGKPIIYSKTEIELNKLGKKIMSNAYKVNTFDEVKNTLNNILIGKDPLKEQREKAKNSYFFKPPKNLTIAQYLLRILIDDYKN